MKYIQNDLDKIIKLIKQSTITLMENGVLIWQIFRRKKHQIKKDSDIYL